MLHVLTRDLNRQVVGELVEKVPTRGGHPPTYLGDHSTL